MDISSLIAQYKGLHLEDVIDHDTFNLIAIDHHSTKIEGSTLTEVETQVLIMEGRTPNGKPLEHSLMVKDHHAALLFTLEAARQGKELNIGLIQQINALVMKTTGKIYNTMLGTIDAATGAFRKGNVSAGNTYFPNYDKVERLTAELLKLISNGIKSLHSTEEQLNLSFDAHYRLVSIHPFYDGNGRTSRLLMNFLQTLYNLPLAIVKSENKAAYIEAIIKTKETGDLNCFREFMLKEYTNLLQEGIRQYREMENPPEGKDFNSLF
ncbi:Fic family protein [Mucilaginibacter phyllosphaerae]|uniref:Fic family protein n=1 Tax=Mucilaginibacter phyllosphaerae TaxID=1812349 RepID=A0A4Y8AFT0_9SPHI|nr:Fic family protein [Mucilaginibacter phyllosphaerae]MBB3968728.1 Fic family protein [Mucilaginibacter phyllosphaerae]TEW67636.1 Fic family protein [Mucilaginibacter phyllosphaerae]